MDIIHPQDKTNHAYPDSMSLSYHYKIEGGALTDFTSPLHEINGFSCHTRTM